MKVQKVAMYYTFKSRWTTLLWCSRWIPSSICRIRRVIWPSGSSSSDIQWSNISPPAALAHKHIQLFLVLTSTILQWTGHTIDISNHSTHYSSIRTRSWSVSYTECRFTTRGLFFVASKTAISWITSALQSRPRRRFLMNFAAKIFPVAFSAHLFTTAYFPLREANRNRKNKE